MTSPNADPYGLSSGLWVPWSLGQVRTTTDEARRTREPAYLPASGWEHMAAKRLPGQKLLALEGWSGTEISGGALVNYDHNANLTPEDWRGTVGRIGRWGQMLREDPVVMAIWGAWMVGISSTPFTIEPATTDGDRHDFNRAAFIRAAYEDHCATPLREYLRGVATYPLTGTALYETAWRVDDTIGKSFEVDGPMLTLAALEPRTIRTVAKWERLDDPLTLARRWGVEQYPPNTDPPDGGDRFDLFLDAFDGPILHPDRLLHHVWNPDGTAPEGIGIMRSMHASWCQRTTYTKIETAGFERGAFGIPVLKVMPNAPRGNDAAAWAAIEGYRVGANHGMVLPPGYEVEFAKPPFDAAALGEAKRSAGREMCRAAHAMHLFTGEDNGTEALIEGQLLAFMGFLQSTVEAIAELHSHGPHSHIRRLIDANWSDVNEYPRMQAGRVRMGDIQKQADYITAGVAANVLTPGADLEEFVRRVGALPDLPQETREQWEARIKTPKIVPDITDPDAGDADPPVSVPPGGIGGEDEGGDTVEPNADQGEEAKEAARALVRLSVHGQITEGPRGRVIRPIEGVCRLAETKGQTSSGREELVAAVVRWRETVAEIVAERVARAPDLKAMRSIVIPGVGALTDQYEGSLRRSYRAGLVSVQNEMERLAADPDLQAKVESGIVERGEYGDGISDVEGRPADLDLRGHGGLSWTEIAGLVPMAPRRGLGKVKAPKSTGPGKTSVDQIDPEDVVQSVAGTTAAAAASRLLSLAIAEAQARSLLGSIPEQNGEILNPVRAAIRTAVIDLIVEMSTAPDSSAAQRDTNTVFGLGRAQEGRASGASHGVFSNLLESVSCDPCIAQDGRTFLLSRLDEFATPYSECEGGDRCNCLVFFIPAEG